MFNFLIGGLTKDHSSFWINTFRKYRNIFVSKWSGMSAVCISSLTGIELGKKCKFYGIPHFERYPFSTITIGENCVFRSDQSSNLIGVNHKCILSTHSKEATIKIGNNCGFSGVTIGAAKEISIGNNVRCGANVVISDFDWHLDTSNTVPKRIIVHDNVWIGLNSVVLKGVEIGENSTIGANSLVTMDIPANVVAGGNPCKIIKYK